MTRKEKNELIAERNKSLVVEANNMNKSGESWKDIAKKFGTDVSNLRKLRRKYDHTVLTYDDLNINSNNVRNAWHKFDSKGKVTGTSVHVVHPKNEKNYEVMRDGLLGDMKKHAPKYPKIKRKKINNPHLLFLGTTDIHFNKLCRNKDGVTYDMEIAEKRLYEGVEQLVKYANPYNIEKIVLLVGSDALHTDALTNSTTRGTVQDADILPEDAFKLARMILTKLIEMLIGIADVHVMLVPGNHDDAAGYFLADSLQCWFAKSKNVTFDVNNDAVKYYQYYKNMLGVTHGDKIKPKDLPLYSATVMKDMWSKTESRHFYFGHLHHHQKNALASKEYNGMVLHGLRSPSEPDRWHANQGYVSKPGIDAFVHSRDGLVAELTHTF